MPLALFFIVMSTELDRSKREAKGRIIIKLAILYIIFNMAASNLNKKRAYTTNKTKPLVATALNKTCLIEQFYCPSTAIFFSLFFLKVLITKIS